MALAVVQTDKLFDICMNFIVKHINLVDSFVGLPDLIGEKIFRKFISENSAASNRNSILTKFVEAYENLILERLSLFKSLLILNEHLESIVIISTCVTELCLCNCYLGESHDIFSHIADFQRLKKLCLRNNSMNDSSIKKFTLRMRMFRIGGKEIEYLDLADNNFTDSMISYLVIFPKLSYLNLTGSKISDKGINVLTRQYSFKQIFEFEQHRDVTNEGWATILLDKWNAELARKREEKFKRTVFRLKLPEILENSQSTPAVIPLVFQKSIQSECVQPPTKKMKS